MHALILFKEILECTASFGTLETSCLFTSLLTGEALFCQPRKSIVLLWSLGVGGIGGKRKSRVTASVYVL